MLLLPLHGKHSMLKDALLHNCDARAKKSPSGFSLVFWAPRQNNKALGATQTLLPFLQYPNLQIVIKASCNDSSSTLPSQLLCCRFSLAASFAMEFLCSRFKHGYG